MNKLIFAMSLASVMIAPNPFGESTPPVCTVCPAGPQGLPGKDGKDGKDGLNGKDGIDGKDGVTTIIHEYLPPELPPIIPRRACNIPHMDGRGFLFVGAIETEHDCYQQIAYQQSTGSIYKVEYRDDGWLWAKQRPVPGVQAHGAWQTFQPFDPDWNNFIASNLAGEFCFISDVNWDNFPWIPIYYLGIDND